MLGLYNWLMQKVEAHATPKTVLLNPNFYQDWIWIMNHLDELFDPRHDTIQYPFIFWNYI